jgi:hypothetical protein
MGVGVWASSGREEDASNNTENVVSDVSKVDKPP